MIFKASKQMFSPSLSLSSQRRTIEAPLAAFSNVFTTCLSPTFFYVYAVNNSPGSVFCQSEYYEGKSQLHIWPATEVTLILHGYPLKDPGNS